jgi:hypothetical protein
MPDLMQDDETGRKLVEDAPKKQEDSDKLENQFAQPAHEGKDAGDNKIKTPSGGAGGSEPNLPRVAGRLQEAAKAVGSFTGDHKKGIGIGGGAAGIVFAIIFMIMALLPLKLEAMMKNILTTRVTAKVEHMVEKRANRVIVGYMADRFGLGVSPSERALYTNNKLLKTLYGRWRQTGFENKFTDSSGLKLGPTDSGKGIRITVADTNKFADFSSADTFQSFLDGSAADGTLSPKATRDFINTVTRDQTKWYQVLKRHNMRNFMKIAYGITKWDFFRGTTGKEAAPEINTTLLTEAEKPLESGTNNVMSCALDGSSCPRDNPAEPGGSLDKPITSAAPIDVPSSLNAGADAATSDSATDSIKTAYATVKKYTPSAITNRVITKLLVKILGVKLGGAIATKFIPIVGQVLFYDQLNRIDHFFNSGNADEALRTIHKVQYATQFAEWLTISDNFKSPTKKMSGDEFNTIMNKLDAPPSDPQNSTAQSPGFQQVFMNSNGGNRKLNPDLGVSDVNAATPIANSYNAFTRSRWAQLASPLLGPFSPQFLGIWFAFTHDSGIAQVINVLNSLSGAVVGALLKTLETQIPWIQTALKYAGNFMANIMTKYLIQPAVDGTEVGADLFTNIDIGGAVTGQGFAQSLGGHPLSPLASAQLQQSIAIDAASQYPSIGDQVFSTNNPNSIVNQLALAMPGTPSQAIRQYTTSALAVIRNPFSFFNSLSDLISGKAHAANNINLYGLTDYGFTDAELNAPLQIPKDYNNDGKIDSKDCYYTSDGTQISDKDMATYSEHQYDNNRLCLLDVTTVEDLSSTSDTADNGGIGDGSNSGAACTTGSCNVFLLGDSITVRANNASPNIASAFTSAGYTLTTDGSVGRSITGPGQSPTTSGLDAVAADKAQITAAQVVIVELGTNYGNDQASMQQLLGAIKADNASAKVYWVNVGAMGYTASRPGSFTTYNNENALISQLAPTSGFSVIDWCGKVFGGSPCTISGNPQNPDLLDPADGVHPSVPSGINAYIQLLLSSMQGAPA